MEKQRESKNDAEKQNGAEWYRKNIIEMVNQAEREEHLLKIYSYIKGFFGNQ